MLDLLNSGDNVMVDCGLDIKDIVFDGVMVNMFFFLVGWD